MSRFLKKEVPAEKRRVDIIKPDVLIIYVCYDNAIFTVSQCGLYKHKKVCVLPIRIVYGLTFRALAVRQSEVVNICLPPIFSMIIKTSKYIFLRIGV